MIDEERKKHIFLKKPWKVSQKTENWNSLLISRTRLVSGSSCCYSSVLQHNLKTISKAEEKTHRRVPGSLNSWPEWTEIPAGGYYWRKNLNWWPHMSRHILYQLPELGFTVSPNPLLQQWQPRPSTCKQIHVS